MTPDDQAEQRLRDLKPMIEALLLEAGALVRRLDRHAARVRQAHGRRLALHPSGALAAAGPTRQQASPRTSRAQSPVYDWLRLTRRPAKVRTHE